MAKRGKKELEQPPEPVILTGEGEFILPDQSSYVGEWMEVDGVKTRQGKGVHTIGPEKYIGNWEKDKMSGEGEYHFSSGAVYKGQFKDNFLEGEGEYTYPDGACYSGSWKENKMHGHGVYKNKDGVKAEGEFFNGTYKNNLTYEPIRLS